MNREKGGQAKIVIIRKTYFTEVKKYEKTKQILKTLHNETIKKDSLPDFVLLSEWYAFQMSNLI